MLVLTRKKGERVMIGDDITITLIDVRGDGVRIGFDAPRGVKIQRAEVVAAVQEANTGAAASAAGGADLLVGLLNKARKVEPATPAPTGAPAATEPAASDRGSASSAAPAATSPTEPVTPSAPAKPAPPKPRP